MFASGLIVFRESLEAALLIGIIAAATRTLPHRNRWIMIGVIAGIIGSLIVAALTESIAQLANGSGQEIFNASIIGIAVCMIGWHSIWMTSHVKEMVHSAKKISNDVITGEAELSAIAIAIALTVLREGSETVLFLHGVLASADSGISVLLGGVGGLFTGLGLGTILYFGLIQIPLRHLFSVTNVLLLLLAAGLASQGARLLAQADLIPSLASPLWDTSHLLSLESPVGKSLHILIGYEAQPTGMQVIFYLMTIVIITLGIQWAQRKVSQAKK